MKQTIKATVVAVAAAAALSACASNGVEPVSQELGKAKSALESARASNANTNAPVIYREASSKVNRAERALESGEEIEAARLAREAKLDARYADLRSDLVRTQALVAELEQGIEDLEAEIAR